MGHEHAGKAQQGDDDAYQVEVLLIQFHQDDAAAESAHGTGQEIGAVAQAGVGYIETAAFHEQFREGHADSHIHAHQHQDGDEEQQDGLVFQQGEGAGKGDASGILHGLAFYGR